MPYANPPANGQRGALFPRHRVGSWYPVMLVELVPSVAAGDSRFFGCSREGLIEGLPFCPFSRATSSRSAWFSSRSR
jgi:hypothetical protein